MLLFIVLNIFAKFRRGPPYGALNTGVVYKFRDFRPISGYVGNDTQELSYRKQIARKLRTQHVDGIYTVFQKTCDHIFDDKLK